MAHISTIRVKQLFQCTFSGSILQFRHLMSFFAKVKDRRIITTNDDETRVLEPQQLQQKIDDAVSKISQARSFVR